LKQLGQKRGVDVNWLF